MDRWQTVEKVSEGLNTDFSLGVLLWQGVVKSFQTFMIVIKSNIHENFLDLKLEKKRKFKINIFMIILAAGSYWFIF